jgi:predicted dehydrogenase
MKKIAFVGAAHIHTPGFVHTTAKRGDIQCKYVWDHDMARAEKCAAGLPGAEATPALDAILADDEVEAIIVCTETNRHEQVVIPAAKAKKHLFVEKPLGFGGADAYRMAHAIEENGVLFQTGYFTRGTPIIRYLKAQVAAGAFGKITRVRGSNCHSGALGRWFDTDWRWMADPTIAGCGAYGDLGTHMLDILLWFFGDVEKVTAQLDPGTNAYEGCDETGEGILRFTNGIIGTLAAAWDDVADPVSFLISGTEGHAAIIHGKLHFQSQHLPGMDGSAPVRNAELPKAWGGAYDNFLDAVLGREGVLETLVTVREAAYRSAVMEALYIGARENRWVTPVTG